MAPFAVTLSDLIEKGGSYAGLAAFFGLAVLAILYFAQAREIRRLRDWAGRAPERAQELEERVIQQADTARKVKAQPIRRPGEPAPVAATAASPAATAAGAAAAQSTVVSKPPPGVSEITEADEAPEDDDSATEHEIVKPAAATPEPADKPAETPAEAQPATAEGEEEKPAEREAVPAGVVASAAVSEPPSIPVAPGNGAPPAEPQLPPRATQGPPVRRPAPAAQPLRASAPPVRRPGAPPRRPGPPPPLRRDEEPGRRRTGIIAVGALAGVTLIVVGLIAILGGGGDDPATTAEPTTAAQTETVEPDTTGTGTDGADDEGSTTEGPTRAETAVAVLNGTTVAGLAATLDDKLLEAGYAEAQEPTNWTDSTRSASVVFYSGSEYRSQAIEVAELLQISDRQAIDDDALALAPNANVVVVVGADQTP